jgi:phosphoglycolate phosphatase-like HAD superfamily hydrolase
LREPASVELRPGVLALLTALAAHPRVHLGIVTGNLERTAWLKLAAGGLQRFFAAGGFGSDARERTGLVAHALQRFGALTGRMWAVSDVWVIGDTPDDVSSGRAHGTRTLAVATGSHDLESLARSGADVVLPDFSDTGRVVEILCDSSPE